MGHFKGTASNGHQTKPADPAEADNRPPTAASPGEPPLPPAAPRSNTKKKKPSGERTYNMIKQMELFAIQPAPRFERRSRYGTTLGLVVTLIVVGISVFYAVLNISRLIEGQRGSVVRAETRDPDPHRMYPLVLTMPYLDDPRYFSVVIQHRRQVPGERSNKTAISGYPGPTPGSIVALERSQGQEAWLNGDCRAGPCEYVRVKVYPCQNSTTPGSLVCVPFADIDHVVNTNYMLLVLRATDPDGDPIDRSFELSLKSALSFRQRFLFNLLISRNRPNYLSTWETQEQTSLQLQAPWFSIDRIPRLTTGEDTEFCKLDFELSGIQLKEERYFTTSLDSIAETAAFFGAISGVAALFMRAYNEYAFYTKYPAWSAFDANFNRLPLNDEEMKRKREREVRLAHGEGDAPAAEMRHIRAHPPGEMDSGVVAAPAGQPQQQPMVIPMIQYGPDGQVAQYQGQPAYGGVHGAPIVLRPASGPMVPPPAPDGYSDLGRQPPVYTPRESS